MIGTVAPVGALMRPMRERGLRLGVLLFASAAVARAAPDAGTPATPISRVADALRRSCSKAWDLEVPSPNTVVLRRNVQLQHADAEIQAPRAALFELRLTRGPPLSVEEHRKRLASLGRTRERLAQLSKRMTQFACDEATQAYSATACFQPRTKAERALTTQYRAVERLAVEPPPVHFEDGTSATVTETVDGQDRHWSMLLGCDDCAAVRAQLEAQLVPYPSKE